MAAGAQSRGQTKWDGTETLCPQEPTALGAARDLGTGSLTFPDQSLGQTKCYGGATLRLLVVAHRPISFQVGHATAPMNTSATARNASSFQW